MNLKQARTVAWIGGIALTVLALSGYATNQPSLTWFMLLGLPLLAAAITLSFLQSRKR